MTQTTNFQLNQWEKSDRIQMADFNADNAKIDAAVAGRLGAIESILAYEYTGGDTYSLSVPLPDGFDWSRWSIVAAEAAPVLSSSGSSTLSLPNEAASSAVGVTLPSGTTPRGMLLLFPARKDEEGAAAMLFPGGSPVRMTGKFGAAFQFTGSQRNGTALKSGTRLNLWGLR